MIWREKDHDVEDKLRAAALTFLFFFSAFLTSYLSRLRIKPDCRWGLCFALVVVHQRNSEAVWRVSVSC